MIEQAGRTSAEFIAASRQSKRRVNPGNQEPDIRYDRQRDIAAAHWGLHALQNYGNNGQISVSEHLAAVAEFLKGVQRGRSSPGQTTCGSRCLKIFPYAAGKHTGVRWQQK